jgi:hypothetical protein
MSPTVPTGRKNPETTPSVAYRASSAPDRMRTSRPVSAAIAREQDYFVDGVTESLMTDLSRIMLSNPIYIGRLRHKGQIQVVGPLLEDEAAQLQADFWTARG